MKKFVLFLFVAALGTATAVNAQWKFQKCFPDTTYKGSAHGVAVSPDGKVWTQMFYAQDTLIIGNAKGDTLKVRGIHVYNPDGTPASFSPIKIYSGTGIQDTNYNSARGLTTDRYNGDILAASYNTVYELNYKTGAALRKYTPPDSSTLTACPTDTSGDVFIGKVLDSVAPGQIIDNTFAFVGNWVDTTRGYSRAFEVSKDGNHVYWCGYTNNAVWDYYSSTGIYGTYAVADTEAKGLQSESACWQPGTNYLWLSQSYVTNAYTQNKWYAFDTKTTPWTLKDSIAWVWNSDPTKGGYKYSSADSANGHPRGIAFSVTGDTTYLAMYNINGPGFEMFTSPATAVNQTPNKVPSTYALSQNYPNPFNPSTKIDYDLKSNGRVNLAVYDVLGRVVATLVNGYQSAGQYSVTFNAAGLSSGVYFYTLRTSNGSSITKKMLLMK